MTDELRIALGKAKASYAAMTPEQKAEMWEAQRQSWLRAMTPCDHGEPDWETCPKCRGWEQSND